MAGDAARPRERALGHCERGVRGDGDDGLRHGKLRRRQPPDRRRRRSEERRVRPPPRGGAGDRRDLGGDARPASGLLERRTGGDADARFRGRSRARAVARRGRARGGAAAERGAARAADRPAPRGARAQQRARPAGRPAAARGPARAAPRRRCRRLLPARRRARRFPLRRGARLRQLGALLRVSDGPGPRRRGRPRRAAVDRERVRRDPRPRAAPRLRRLHRRDHSPDVLERRGARGARRRPARGAPLHGSGRRDPRGLRGPRLARVAERGDVHAERAAGADPAGLLPDRLGARAVAVSSRDARGGRPGCRRGARRQLVCGARPLERAARGGRGVRASRGPARDPRRARLGPAEPALARCRRGPHHRLLFDRGRRPAAARPPRCRRDEPLPLAHLRAGGRAARRGQGSRPDLLLGGALVQRRRPRARASPCRRDARRARAQRAVRGRARVPARSRSS